MDDANVVEEVCVDLMVTSAGNEYYVGIVNGLGDTKHIFCFKSLYKAFFECYSFSRFFSVEANYLKPSQYVSQKEIEEAHEENSIFYGD